jgi:hypothetical protein
MTAANKLRREIIFEAMKREAFAKVFYNQNDEDPSTRPQRAIAASNDVVFPSELFDTPEKIDAWFHDTDNGEDIDEAINVIRSGQFETDLPTDDVNNFYSTVVAHQAMDGSWIGWNYYHSPEEHDCLEATKIPWIEEAVDLEMKEEVVTKTVMTFAFKK